MAYDISGSIINDVLCYISTSRNTLSRDSITLNAVAFYKSEFVKQAKEVIFKVYNETPIQRKSCKMHPNPTVADIEDILCLFDKMDENNFICPKFLAENYLSLPPSNGFEPLALIICSLRDELLAVRLEVSELRKMNEKDAKALEGNANIQQDITDIKLMIKQTKSTYDKPEHMGAIPKVRTYADATSNESSDVTYDRSGSSRKNLSSSTVDNEGKTFEVPVVNKSTRNNSINNVSSIGNNGYASSSGNVGKNLKRTPRIVGTRKGTSGNMIGAQRVYDVFVGGCGLNSTALELQNYCNSSGVSVKKIESLPTKSEWYKAYKISISASDREILLDPNFWLEGIFVRKFFKPREKNAA